MARYEHGAQNPVVRYEWSCPVTSWRVSSEDEKEARREMLAHDCGGAGWCPVPPRPQPPPSGQLNLLEER